MILDVGCGCREVHTPRGDVGVDLHGNPNGNPELFAAADGHCLPFMDEQFEVVSLYEVLEHVENPFGVIRETWRVLKRDGVFRLSVPNQYFWRILLWRLVGKAVWRDHIHAFNEHTLINLLSKCGFTVTLLDYILVPERWIRDKRLHRSADSAAYKLRLMRRFTAPSLLIECRKTVGDA